MEKASLRNPTESNIAVLRHRAAIRRSELSRPADPYIYHHKWLFVDDDYRGFNVEESKVRSQHWIGLGDVDRSRIGRESYWNEQVIPRLSGTIPVRWVRSDEVRKRLKLSTCDLAHMREAGKIEFKKVGNAFLYRLS